MYTKHILNSTIFANIKVYSIQMQCVIEALMRYSKRFDKILEVLVSKASPIESSTGDKIAFVELGVCKTYL